MGSPEREAKSTNRKKGSWAWTAGLILLLSKAKSLIGLLKLQTLLTALISVAFYATVYPWTFAIGLVALLFLHEMGHVWAAKRRGLPVSAPLFIPFFGALIMMKRNPKDAETEAAIALGGPMLGSLAALVCFGLWEWTGYEAWVALAYIGFLINLFNLLPMHPLDGGRIAAAVSRWLWVVGVVAFPIIIWYTGSFIYVIIWIWLMWHMYKRFFGERNRKDYNWTEGVYQTAADPLLPSWYYTGQVRRGSLPISAYCRMDGQHVATFYWEQLNYRGEMEINQPCIVHNATVVQVSEPDEANQITFTVRLYYELYEPSNYYEVSALTRIKYGVMYGGLAAALFAMMAYIHQIGALER